MQVIHPFRNVLLGIPKLRNLTSQNYSLRQYKNKLFTNDALQQKYITLENLKDGLKQNNEKRVDPYRFTKIEVYPLCVKKISLYNCTSLCGSQYNLTYIFFAF